MQCIYFIEVFYFLLTGSKAYRKNTYLGTNIRKETVWMLQTELLTYKTLYWN